MPPPAAAMAASATSFMATTLLRRTKPSAQMRTRGRGSRRRLATASAAYPEKMGTKTAPMRAAARKAAIASGDMGRNTPTASPASTPRRISPPANRLTLSSNSEKDQITDSPLSRSPITAGASGRVSAQRSTQAADKLISPPTNQVAHWGPRETSRTSV